MYYSSNKSFNKNAFCSLNKPQRGHYLYTVTLNKVIIYILSPSTRSLFIYCHTQQGHYLYTVTLNVVIFYILSPSTWSLSIYCHPQRGHILYTVTLNEVIIYILSLPSRMHGPRGPSPDRMLARA